MGFQKTVSSIFLKCSRYQLRTDFPLPPKAILIGAPHTSNWDAIYMVMGLWHLKKKFRFFVKSQAVNSPLGPLIRKLGGWSVDRSSAHGLVEQVVAEFATADELLLIITPKGTRGKREYWKSGFYHMALQAQVPLVLGYLDFANSKSYGWGELYYLTGDIHKDMEYIRAFYADKSGVKPQFRSTPRLRDE